MLTPPPRPPQKGHMARRVPIEAWGTPRSRTDLGGAGLDPMLEHLRLEGIPRNLWEGVSHPPIFSA